MTLSFSFKRLTPGGAPESPSCYQVNVDECSFKRERRRSLHFRKEKFSAGCSSGFHAYVMPVSSKPGAFKTNKPKLFWETLMHLSHKPVKCVKCFRSELQRSTLEVNNKSRLNQCVPVPTLQEAYLKWRPLFWLELLLFLFIGKLFTSAWS